MSEFPPSGASGAEAKVPAFADALQRAKQIASKIRPGAPASSSVPSGLKRPIEDSFGDGPEVKKSAALNDPFGAQLAARHNNMMEAGIDMGGPVSTEVIMVPDKMVGLIIGRGGEQITRLQAESSCKIQMAQDSAGMSERQCTLSGTAGAIAHARGSIERIIANEGNGPPRGPGGPPGGGMGGGGGGGGGGPTGLGGGSYEMLVPGHKVGLIIGKGGETIKQLQERSGAKIIIIQDSPEAAHEKPLRITGPPESVESAKAAVVEILNQNDDREMGGFGGRGRGRGGPRGGGGGRGGFMGGRGGPRGGGGGRGGFGGGWGGGGGGGEYGAEHTDYVTIPSNKCGLIIGKGGETIKNINSSTGAHCEVDKSAPPDAREKNFIIRGTPDAVERAKSMIMEKLGMQPGGGSPYGGYGGGSGGGSWGVPGGGGGGGGGVGVNPATGQPDYSAQWVEYYKSMGMNKEADAIEQQARSRAQTAVAPAPAAVAPSNGAPNGAGADYSAQWAEYYRSIGKVKEAEAIEAQMKQKVASAAPGGPGYPGAQYGGYYGGQAPSGGPPASNYPGPGYAAGYPAYGGQPGAES